MNRRVILLNGPSSSGKSTLAASLRAELEGRGGGRYAITSIDDFLPMSTEEAIYEEDVYAISPALCERVRELLASGENVLIDHVITSERIYHRLRSVLSGCGFLFIRVACALPELLERERRRGNRRAGSAEASSKYLYPQEGYDLTVDTSESTSEACAARIADLALS